MQHAQYAMPVQDPMHGPGTKFDAETERQLDRWVAAKRDKDFNTADAIRAELRSKGIDPDTVRPPGHDMVIDEETEQQLDRWVAAKREKDFALADAIRAELRAKRVEPDIVRPPGYDTIIDEEVEKQLDRWVAAKREKDFATADALRAELRKKGVEPDIVRPPGHDTVIDAEVERKLDRWVEAKRNKDFVTADAIRAELRAKGVEPDNMRPPGYVIPSAPVIPLVAPARPHVATVQARYDAFTQHQLDTWVEAKRNKDFTTADAIRVELRKKGIEPDEVRPAGRDLHPVVPHVPILPRGAAPSPRPAAPAPLSNSAALAAAATLVAPLVEAISSALQARGIGPEQLRPLAQDLRSHIVPTPAQPLQPLRPLRPLPSQQRAAPVPMQLNSVTTAARVVNAASAANAARVVNAATAANAARVANAASAARVVNAVTAANAARVLSAATAATAASALEKETQRQLDQWVEAKRARDFKLADEIRSLLRNKGIDPDTARPSRPPQDMEPLAKRFRLS